MKIDSQYAVVSNPKHYCMPFLAVPKKFSFLFKTQHGHIQSCKAVGRWQQLQKFGAPKPISSFPWQYLLKAIFGWLFFPGFKWQSIFPGFKWQSIGRTEIHIKKLFWNELCKTYQLWVLVAWGFFVSLFTHFYWSRVC